MSIANERDKPYGDAYARTGIVLSAYHEDVQRLLREHATLFVPFCMILNKLFRALVSPNNRDHWVDIIGYAELALRELALHQGDKNE